MVSCIIVATYVGGLTFGSLTGGYYIPNAVNNVTISNVIICTSYLTTPSHILALPNNNTQCHGLEVEIFMYTILDGLVLKICNSLFHVFSHSNRKFCKYPLKYVECANI